MGNARLEQTLALVRADHLHAGIEVVEFLRTGAVVFGRGKLSGRKWRAIFEVGNGSSLLPGL